jgi:hypothetical protein
MVDVLLRVVDVVRAVLEVLCVVVCECPLFPEEA